MSRAKVGYEFCPTPRRRHAAWAGATVFETGLRERLFELNDGGAITVEGDWLESLCKQAAVNGRERPPARKVMLDWQSRGLLFVDGLTVSIVVRHDAELRPVVVESSSIGSESSSSGRRTQVQLKQKPRNDSNPVGETDETRREETEENTTTTLQGPSVVSAPPVWVDRSPENQNPILGYKWFEQLKGGIAPALHTCQRDYNWIGARPASERLRVAQSVTQTQWCADNRGKVTPSHVVRYWASYLDGPRNREEAVASVTPVQAAYQKMKAAEKAYREAEKYREPTDDLWTAWNAATNEYSELQKRAS